MPLWTFTSGPNQGKQYHGSAKVEEEEQSHDPWKQKDSVYRDEFDTLKELIKEGNHWGKIQNLKCRRNLERVQNDVRAYLADFDVMKMQFNQGELYEECLLMKFKNIPVIQKEQVETGEPIVIENNVRQDDLIEVLLLSDFTCVWKKMTSTNLNNQLLVHQRKVKKEKISSCPLLYSRSYRKIGNQKFKNGMYVDAIECYTIAIRQAMDKEFSKKEGGKKVDMTQDLMKALANRALAFLKVQRFNEAEQDCNEALSDIHVDFVDEDLRVKLLFRRAMARYELQYFGEAFDDLEALLRLDKDNRDAKRLMDMINNNEGGSEDDEKPHMIWDNELNAPRIVGKAFAEKNQMDSVPIKKFQEL